MEGREVPGTPGREPHADWLAWSLQLLFGCIAGAGIGFMVARGLCRSDLAELDQIPGVAAGMALCCGAFTSFHGNRAWMARSLFAPPDAPTSRKSRICSTVIGTIGILLICVSITWRSLSGDRAGGEEGSGDFDWFVLILAALPGFLVFHALRTGTVLWQHGMINREETPLTFWAFVLINGVLTIGILSAML